MTSNTAWFCKRLKYFENNVCMLKILLNFRCHHNCWTFIASKYKIRFNARLLLKEDTNITISFYWCCSYCKTDKLNSECVVFISNHESCKIDIGWKRQSFAGNWKNVHSFNLTIIVTIIQIVMSSFWKANSLKLQISSKKKVDILSIHIM